MPKDFGAHQRISSSGLVQASNTMRAGASNTLVTTSSRSDRRSFVVSVAAPVSLVVASIGLLLLFRFLDDLVQLVETGSPELPVALDPRGLLFETTHPQPASPHPADLLGDDEPRMLQHADVLLHAGEGHLERVGKLGDRRVLPREPFKNAT